MTSEKKDKKMTSEIILSLLKQKKNPHLATGHGKSYMTFEERMIHSFSWFEAMLSLWLLPCYYHLQSGTEE